MQIDSFIWDKMRFVLPIVTGVLERSHYSHINLSPM